MSSITIINFPSYIFTYSSFRINVLACPICSGPEGKGAILITTFPFSALGRGFSPSLISLLEVLESDFSRSFSCSSGDKLLTSFRTFWIVGMMFFISDFSRPSANSPARTAPWFALPPCLIAFSRA